MRCAAAILLAASVAHAGGTERPNGISPRGVGMGGAWAAWADDATAIFFNPAALDVSPSHVMLGGELVVGPRSYVPPAGDAQATTVVAPVPTAGIVGRFNAEDRFTLGLGVWNSFGGQVRYDKTGMPALDASQDVCVEVDGAAALHVSDRLAIGAAIRAGIGLFHLESTMSPFDADLSASGVGVAMTWGALFRPTETIRIGLAWRSPLHIATKGSGTIDLAGTIERHDIVHEQKWPQSASLGVGWQATPAVKLAVQVDWTAWSEVDTLSVKFPAGELPDQIYPEYWRDTWTARLGGEYAVSDAVAVRAGTYFDQSAVPDRTIERQYLDSNKVGISAGASLRAAGWRFDAALDGIVPSTRTVPDNASDVMGVGALQNKAPGAYSGTLITFELAAVREL